MWWHRRIFILWCTTVNRHVRRAVSKFIDILSSSRNTQQTALSSSPQYSEILTDVCVYPYAVTYTVFVIMFDYWPFTVTLARWGMSAVTFYFCTANNYCSLQLAQLLNNVWPGTVYSFVVCIVDLFVCNVEDTRNRTAGWQIVFCFDMSALCVVVTSSFDFPILSRNCLVTVFSLSAYGIITE